MRFDKLFAAPGWKLFPAALFLQLDTLIRFSLRWRERGLKGLALALGGIVKYASLGVFGYLWYGWRAGVFFSFHAWFRRIDDSLDSVSAPANWRSSYLEVKRRAGHCLIEPRHRDWEADLEDILAVHAVCAAARHGIDISYLMRELCQVMAADAIVGQKMFPRERTLWEIATRQDDYILTALVRIFGGNEKRLGTLLQKSYGVFTRIDWLIDMPADLSRGVIRISDGDAELHGIELATCLAVRTRRQILGNPGLMSWCMGEVQDLRRQSECIRQKLGSDFGGIFPSRLTGRLFDRFIVRRFERSLQSFLEVREALRV